MPVTTDNQGNFFIGSTSSGATLGNLYGGVGGPLNYIGDLADIRNLSGVKGGFQISQQLNSYCCFTLTAPPQIGGEVLVNPVDGNGWGTTPITCASSITTNLRMSVMLWVANGFQRLGFINSGFVDGQKVTVNMPSPIECANTWTIASNPNARFWMTLSQQRYITFFCYVDQSNYYSVEFGYTHAVSGVLFPMNCIIKYNIVKSGGWGSESYWTAIAPSALGMTQSNSLPQAGKTNYSHVTLNYGTKDATNLYAVTDTLGIGRCGTNLKITRASSLYPQLKIRDVIYTDSDVLGSPKRSYLIYGKTGDDPLCKLLIHFNGLGDITGDKIIEETRPTRVWQVTASDDPSVFSNIVSKFSSGAARITSSSPISTTSDVGDFLLGTNDFTIQWWLYPPLTTFSSQVFLDYSQWKIEISSTSIVFTDLTLVNSVKTFTFTQGTIISLQFNHIALSRVGTSLYCFVNGVQVSSTATFASMSTSLTPASFAIKGNGWYIDELSIHSGTGKGFYSGAFTPPTIPYSVTPELLAMQIG